MPNNLLLLRSKGWQLNFANDPYFERIFETFNYPLFLNPTVITTAPSL